MYSEEENLGEESITPDRVQMILLVEKSCTPKSRKQSLHLLWLWREIDKRTEKLKILPECVKGLNWLKVQQTLELPHSGIESLEIEGFILKEKLTPIFRPIHSPMMNHIYTDAMA